MALKNEGLIMTIGKANLDYLHFLSLCCYLFFTLDLQLQNIHEAYWGISNFPDQFLCYFNFINGSGKGKISAQCQEPTRQFSCKRIYQVNTTKN